MSSNTTWTSVGLPVPKSLHASLIVLISVFASIEHSFVMLAVYRYKELRSIPYLIIFNLSVADILFAAIVLPLDLCDIFPLCLPTCYFRGFGSTLLLFASENIVAFISVERFLAINYPFKHRQWFDTKLTVKCLLSIWLFCAVLTFVPVYTSGYGHIEGFYHCALEWWDDKLTTFILVIFQNVFIVMILVYCNVNILKTVRKRRSIGPMTRDLRFHKERKTSVMVTMVIATYCICFTPYCSILYCFLIANECAFPDAFAWIALLLLRLNCCVNPLIYASMNRKFRKAFKEMLGIN